VEGFAVVAEGVGDRGGVAQVGVGVEGGAVEGFGGAGLGVVDEVDEVPVGARGVGVVEVVEGDAGEVEEGVEAPPP
jgi:hypothetical protein